MTMPKVCGRCLTNVDVANGLCGACWTKGRTLTEPLRERERKYLAAMRPAEKMQAHGYPKNMPLSVGGEEERTIQRVNAARMEALQKENDDLKLQLSEGAHLKLVWEDMPARIDTESASYKVLGFESRALYVGKVESGAQAIAQAYPQIEFQPRLFVASAKVRDSFELVEFNIGVDMQHHSMEPTPFSNFVRVLSDRNTETQPQLPWGPMDVCLIGMLMTMRVRNVSAETCACELTVWGLRVERDWGRVPTFQRYDMAPSPPAIPQAAENLAATRAARGGRDAQ
jgi:hypothetical protein